MAREAVEFSDTMCEEQPEILKSDQLLSEAQSLMKSIKEMLDWFASGPSSHRSTERQAITEDCEDDEDMLDVDGIQFYSTANEEQLRRLSL